MGDFKHTGFRLRSSSSDIENSNYIPSPEKPRGAEACESYAPGSPQMQLLFDQFACIKNSTICNDKDTENIESLSAFLPSSYLSPIQHKSPSTFVESMCSESITDNSASFCRSSNPNIIFEQNISDLSYSPVKPELTTSPLKMSTLPEVTEPLSSTFKELSIETNVLEDNKVSTDVKVSRINETIDPTLITPKKVSLDHTFDLSRRTSRLLLAPYIACEYESSDEDNLECPPVKPPAPIMCMWQTEEQEVAYENTALNISMGSVGSNKQWDTVDKSTQTTAEFDVPALYYSPRGDPSATQLKEWMNKIFDNKLPDFDS
ncbi:unnamed protein product [Rodentolepis nana]|uniref:Protein aurora borealis n=1 Tax=Rodentolepis nana TaxID=102285 RepID=A0A0R3TPG8_RODNA|nr:unnamed protein product [Rodentolepis nana]